ncbi:hypothetical protein ETD86_01520 [Nonomuraea turkmeniaca]|uniref:Uncharacterized protein n=1 Tax=Nonomuraea turkmeniaca TaxID=103838 RepID=A0A5S4FYW2_9ACTN|nr:hypothetical protein [Nonomuraea turkmeniaca]TMR25301.1 hypothetical protein ETD86_01520 [Nonomuraea turkmeniaca]
MSAEQVTGNKALFSRFHEAINSGDAEVIAKTIDELVAVPHAGADRRDGGAGAVRRRQTPRVYLTALKLAVRHGSWQ